MMNDNYTYVYFITTENKGNTPIKIGVSINPELRIKELQTGNPFKLKILKIIPCLTKSAAYALESALHELTKSTNKRMIGEWFKIYEPINPLVGMCLKRMSKNKLNVIGSEAFIKEANISLRSKRNIRKNKRLKKSI